MLCTCVCRENLDVSLPERFARNVAVDAITLSVLAAAMLLMYALFGKSNPSNAAVTGAVANDDADDSVGASLAIGSNIIDIPTTNAAALIVALHFILKWLLERTLGLIQRPRSLTEAESGKLLLLAQVLVVENSAYPCLLTSFIGRLVNQTFPG